MYKIKQMKDTILQSKGIILQSKGIILQSKVTILQSKDILTCVSCYYTVKNKHSDKYINWFKNTLSINVPYVFFSDKDGIECIKQFRKDLPTVYIEYPMNEFYNEKYRDVIKTHPIHCPSVELKMIWNEKMIMLQKASSINPFHSEYFQWIDAGICVYRNQVPPSIQYPTISKLNAFPKDKLLYSSSSATWNENLVKPGNYYHYIAGTSYILHNSFIDTFVSIYKKYLDQFVSLENIWTDQCILTHIFKDYPDLFFKVCDGYGEIVKHLF